MAKFIVLSLIFGLALGEFNLKPLNTIYLPYEFDQSGSPQFDLFSAAAEQIGYHQGTKKAYAIGGAGLLHVIDLSSLEGAELIHSEHVEGEPNDLDICDDFIALSVRNDVSVLPGKAVIFKVYQNGNKSMEKIHEIPIGNCPASSIVFTKDCKTLLVANEGEAGLDENGKFHDPEGSVTVINFKTDNLLKYTVRTATFHKFHDR